MSVARGLGGWWGGALRRPVLWMLAVSVAGAMLLAAAVGPSTALGSSTLNWPTGIQAPLPGDVGTNPDVELHSVSCASPGNCTAVGRYRDTPEGRQGLLLTETHGTWAGVKATLPAGADADPIAALDWVSCASAGNCSAVGSYRDTSGNTHGLLMTETSGTWGAGVEATLPSAASNPQVVLNSVSCTSPGNCSAVGDFIDSSGNLQGLLLTETSGTWAAGVQATLPAAASNPSVVLGSVSCVSAGNCTAVGEYLDSSSHRQGLVLRESTNTWATGTTAVLPAAAADPQAVLGSVSCVSVDDCAVGGYYTDNSGHGQGLLLTETSGSWAAAKATLPAGTLTDPGGYVQSVSCTAAGYCSAVGGYTDSSGAFQGVLLTQTAGTWGAGHKAVLPAGAAANPEVSLDSVSCFSAGNCAAVGEFNDSSGTQGLLFSENSGNWGAGAKASLPANPGSDPKVVMDGVSCSSVTSCTAIGRYVDNLGHNRGLLLASAKASPRLVVVAPSSGTVGRTIAGSSVSGNLSLGATPIGGMQFRVFGPQPSPPSSCSAGGKIVGGTISVSGNRAYHPSAGITPGAAGTYWWYAGYSGDLGDNAAASACGTSMAKTVVRPVPVVSGFKQTHARWREGSGLPTIAAKRKAPVGTAFTFLLNQPARLKLVFKQHNKAKGALSLAGEGRHEQDQVPRAAVTQEPARAGAVHGDDHRHKHRQRDFGPEEPQLHHRESSIAPGRDVRRLCLTSGRCWPLLELRLCRPRTPSPTEPCNYEDAGTRQAGDEHHHAVDHSRGDPPLRTQASRTEYPCRHALAWPQAGDTGQHHGRHHKQHYRKHPRRRRGGAGGPCRDQEGRRVAGDDQQGRQRDARPRPPGEQPVADVAARSAQKSRPRRLSAIRPRARHKRDAE